VIDPYRPEVWHDFFLAAAGGAAALTGLLFVALSLHIRFVTSSRMHRGMAWGSLIGLVLVLVTSLVTLIPQARQWNGGELLIVNLGYLLLIGPGQIANLRRMNFPIASVTRVAVGYLLAVIGVWGGFGLIAGVGGGLYWIALQVVAIVVWNLLNAWLLLIDISADEA
jgi:modulator of FtsH protease